MKYVALLVWLVGCSTDVDDDSDLDADPDLAAIAADDMPEELAALDDIARELDGLIERHAPAALAARVKR